jgi:hypothetical protein
MPDINDLFKQIPIDQIAKELGVSHAEAEHGVAVVLPALVSGMMANAKDPKGDASLLKALKTKDTSLLDGGVKLGDIDVADGKKIVKHIFGDAAPDVAAKLGSTTPVGAVSMGKLLPILAPILAPIVMAFLAKHALGSKKAGGASGGLSDILGGILGGGGSGGGLGGVLGNILSKGVGGGSSSSSSSGGLGGLGDLLGGLLGGGTK